MIDHDDAVRLAEQATLGSLLYVPESTKVIGTWLRPGDFADMWHAHVYRIIHEHHHIPVNAPDFIPGKHRLHQNRQDRRRQHKAKREQPAADRRLNDALFQLIQGHENFDAESPYSATNPQRPGSLQPVPSHRRHC